MTRARRPNETDRDYMLYLSARGWSARKIARHLKTSHTRVLYQINPEFRRDQILRARLVRQRRTPAQRDLDNFVRKLRRELPRAKDPGGEPLP